MRPLLVVGNWKMNPASLNEAAALAEAVKVGVGALAEPRTVVCPAFVHLSRVDEILAGSPIGLGAQDMAAEPSGAFTGDVSGGMLVDVGCTHVILGHSERRHLRGEQDATVNRKLRAALDARLLPIVCVGETLDERQAGQTEPVVARQLAESLDGVTAESLAGIVIAYEPVWAIGTGHTATPEQAQDVHHFIRGRLDAMHPDAAIGSRVGILYGGSVKPENARDLMAQPDVDGVLVGGASLKAPEFLAIFAAARGLFASGSP